jgi:glycine cleavage system aminomethyltransferase T
MSDTPLKSIGVVPDYPDVLLYANLPPFGLVIWEADPWQETTMSWKESCYIHGGLNLTEAIYEGTDVQKVLSLASINNVYKWPIGKSKHLVHCDKDGLITGHWLTHRDSETRFRQFAARPSAVLRQTRPGMDFKFSTRNVFIFQFAGPKSLQVLEKATGESLRDVEFLAARPTRIPGIPAEIEVARIGMAGTLAYELRGAAEHGPAVYDAVYQVGKPLGMKRLGWLSYVVNHVEGGFPQLGCTFSTHEMLEYHANIITGSVDPGDIRARLRTPGEVGWTWMAKFDHEFEGREAVEAEAKNPKRTIVTLRWYPEDVVDIYASLFQKGEDYKTFPLPSQSSDGGHADYVTTTDGKKIGISSGTTYSYYYREMISHCTIDVDQAKIGNNVIVHWGDYGKRIKEVRATVERFPYLDLPRNEKYDLSTVPSGI